MAAAWLDTTPVITCDHHFVPYLCSYCGLYCGFLWEFVLYIRAHHGKVMALDQRGPSQRNYHFETIHRPEKVGTESRKVFRIMSHRYFGAIDSAEPVHQKSSTLLWIRKATGSSGGDLAPSLGGTEKKFADQDFWLTFFQKKIPFSRPKFLMTFSLITDQVFRIFTFFSQFSVSFTMLNGMSYMTLSSQEPLFQERIPLWHLFYSVRTFARIRQDYFSKYWGDGCRDVLPPQILRGLSPQSP